MGCCESRLDNQRTDTTKDNGPRLYYEDGFEIEDFTHLIQEASTLEQALAKVPSICPTLIYYVETPRESGDLWCAAVIISSSSQGEWVMAVEYAESTLRVLIDDTPNSPRLGFSSSNIKQLKFFGTDSVSKEGFKELLLWLASQQRRERVEHPESPANRAQLVYQHVESMLS